MLTAHNGTHVGKFKCSDYKTLYLMRLPPIPLGAVHWSPSRDPALSRSAAPLTGGPVLPSLLDTCLAVLTEYVDCIETLAGVPDAMKVESGRRTGCVGVLVVKGGAPNAISRGRVGAGRREDVSVMGGGELIYTCCTRRIIFACLGPPPDGRSSRWKGGI